MQDGSYLQGKVSSSDIANAGVTATVNSGQTLTANTLVLKPTTVNAAQDLSYAYGNYTLNSETHDDYWLSLVTKTALADNVGSAQSSLINNGGTVTIGTLDVSNGSYTQNSGTTTIDSITGNGNVTINGGTLKAAGLLNVYSATPGSVSARKLSSPSTSVSVSSMALGSASGVSGLTSLANKISMTGGTLHISGTYDTNVADQARTLIRNKYGSGVNVTFGSTYTDTYESARAEYRNYGFTTNILNSLYSESGQSDLIFNGLDWNARNADLTIGSGAMAKSIGVRNVTNAGSITVNSGKTFAILGTGSSQLAGGVFTADNGTLQFGASGLTSGGTASSVTLANGGKFNVANGTFTVNSLSGKGATNVSSGSKLIVNNLSFATGSSLTSAGTLQTGLDNVFQGISDSSPAPLKYIGIDAQSQESVKTHASSLFTQYVPGTVADSLADHASFTGGTVIVDNSGRALTTTQVNDLKAAFAAEFGSAATVTFSGTVSGTSRNDTLSAAKVNQLHDAGVGLDGVIYVDRNFDAQSGNAVFGDSGVRNDAGFAGIGSATGVTVQNGRQLVLVGAAGNADYSLTSAAAKVSGTGSELQLGSLGLTNASGWKGKTGSVELEQGAALHAAAGDYKVASIKGTGGSSLVKTDAGAKLTLGSVTLTSGADFTNEGTTTVTGAFEGTGGGTYINTGTMTVEGAVNAVGNASLTNSSSFTAKNGISLIGTLTNQRGGTLTVAGDTLVNSATAAFSNEGMAVLNGNLSVAGTLSNALGAVLQTNTLSVTGQINNYGRIEALNDSTLYGTLTNAGTISLYNTVVGSAGRLTNSGLTNSITGVGTITVNGLLSNVNNADFTGEILNAEGSSAEVTNQSAMTLGRLNVSNGAEFTNTGSLKVDTMTVGAGGYQSNQSAASATSASNFALREARAGTRAVEQIRTLNIAVGGSKVNNGDAWYGQGTVAGTFTNGTDGYTIAGISDIWPDGTGFIVSETGVIANGGTFAAAGAISNAGTIRGDGEFILQREGAGTNVFTNTGSVNVGTLTADRITYEQTQGSTTADAGWFTQSTVNVKGGTMNYAGSTGSGNTYTIGDGTSDTIVARAEFGTVDSASTINIVEGGELKALNIQLDGTANTVNLMGGHLVTTLDQIFEDVYHKAWDIDAQGPGDEVNFSGVNIATGISDLKDEVSSGINFGYGLVVFNDGVFSAVMASDVLGKLDADDVDPTGHEGLLEVAFNGAASEKFNVTLANAVRAAGPNGATFATFTNETLTNEVSPATGFTKLYVGDTGGAPSDANVLEQSIGFKNIAGVTGGITVADGRHLVLVGDLQSSPWAPEAILDGDLTIKGAGTTVTLGSYATEGKTHGHIEDIALQNGGVMRVRHGDFAGEWLTSGDGAIYIGGDGTTVVNGMTLTADTNSSLTLNGYAMGDGSLIVSYGTFAADEVTAPGTAGTGEITNYGHMTLTSGVTNGYVTNNGTFESDDLTISAGSSTTGFDNKVGAEANIKVLKSEAGTRIANSGTLKSETALTVNGTFANEDGSVQIGTLTVGGSGEVENKAALTAQSLRADGSVTNAASGTMTLSQTADSQLAGTLSNSGTLTISGGRTFEVATGGALLNTGAITADGEVKVTGGTLTQDSDVAMSLADLTVTDGSVAVELGRRLSGTGTLEVNAPTALWPLVNDGETIFNTVRITAGTVSGTGTFGKDDEPTGTFGIGAAGRVDLADGTVYADSFANEGTASIGLLDVDEGDNRSGATLDFGRLVSGDFKNAGTVHTTGPAEIVGSIVTNTGNWTADDSTVVSGGSFTHRSATAAEFDDLTLADGANLTVDAGSTVGADSLTAQNGTRIENSGTLEGAMTLSGTVLGTGTLDGGVQSVIVTDTGDVIQGTLIGVLENRGSATLGTLTTNGASSSSGALAINERMDGTGSLINTEAGTLTTDGLTVAADLVNRGAFTATGEVVVDEDGSITATSDRTMHFTDLTIRDGSLTVTADAGAVGSGNLTVAVADPAETAVTNDGFIDFANLHVASGTVTGRGTMGSSSSSVSVDSQGTVTQQSVVGKLTNAGTVTADNVELSSGSSNEGDLHILETFEGSLTNKDAGSVTVGKTGAVSEFVSGEIVNEGTFNGLGTVKVTGGKLSQKSDTAMVFDDLVVTDGVFEIAAGSKAEGGSITVSAGTNGHVARTNDGTADFETITVNAGSVTGSGTLGSSDAEIIVLEDAVVSQGTVHGNISNDGSIAADKLISEGESTNAGLLAVHDELSGNLVNTGTLRFEGTNGAEITSGTITNRETLNATEKVTVAGGSLIHDSASTAEMTALAVENGSVTVTDESTMIGSGSLTVKASGSVTNDGTMIFANTEVSGTVTGMGSFGSENAEITVSAGGSLTQKTLMGELENAGTVILEDAVLSAGSSNSGAFNLSGSFRGDLTNTAAGTFTGDPAETIEILEGSLRNEGTFRANGVTLSGGNLMQASDTAMAIEDLQIADGTLTVETGREADLGSLAMTSAAAAAANDGTIAADTIDIEAGTVTGTGILGTTASSVSVADGASVTQDTVKGVLTNAGDIAADHYEFGNAGTSTNTAGGSLVVHDSIKGSLTNEGTLNAQGTGGLTLTDGTLTNLGSFSASESVTIRDEGILRQSSATDIVMTDLTVGEGGRLETDAATAVRGSGTLTVEGTSPSDNQIVNNGVVDFGNIRINKGSVTGTGTLGSETAVINVSGDGSVAQSDIVASELGNAGSMTGDFDVGTLDNTGVINAGILAADRIVNEAAGTVDAGVLTVTGGIENAGSLTAGAVEITGSAENSGHFAADTLEAAGGFTNEGSLVVSADADIIGLDNRTGADAAFEGSAVLKDSILGGTVTAEADLTLDGTNTMTGTVEAENGLTVKNGTTTLDGAGASLTVTGGMEFDSATFNAAEGTFSADRVTLSETGALVTSGTAGIDELTGTGGRLELAGGTTDIGRITATSTDVLISAATDLTAEKGWFTDSVIDIRDGRFDADATIHDIDGNLTGDLGYNVYNVGNVDRLPVEGPDSTLPAADKADWKAPYVVLEVDRVTSDTVINVGKGGVLDVEHIELTPAEAGVTVTIGTGGGLQTSLDQFFDSVTTTVTDIEAVDPETGRVDIVTDVIATTTVGSVFDSVKNGLTFENGSMVAFDDDDWSVQLVSSVTNSLTQAGLIGSDTAVQQHYLGEFMGDFTVDTATALIEEQRLIAGGSAVLDPGIVFDSTTLHNNTSAVGGTNRELVIGIADGSAELPAGANGIEVSMGFKDIANADAVTVTNGRELVLVGGARPDDFDWTADYDDSNRLLRDAADGGKVTADDGTFTMGSWGVTGPTAGWIGAAEVGAEGELVTKNGEFAVWDLENAGSVDVTKGSILHAEDIDNTGTVHVSGGFTAGGTFTNEGNLFVEKGAAADVEMLVTTDESVIISDGALMIGSVSEIKGTLENEEHGNLTAESDATISGSVTNEGSAIWQDVTVTGSMDNSGSEQGLDLVIAEGGTKTNSGLSVWENADIAGTLENTADGDGMGFKVGTGADGEHFGITGEVINSGRLDASDAVTTMVSGSITNSGTAVYDDMIVAAGGSSANTGVESGDILTVGGEHTNSGTSMWNSVVYEAGSSGANGEAIPDGAPLGHEEGFASDAVTVIGSDLNGETFDVEGSYTNNGILNASEAETTTVGGTLANSGQALYDDMTVTDSGLSRNFGYEKGDLLNVAGSHENSGVSIWNGIIVSGTGEVLNSVDGITDVNGRFDVAGIFTNEGTLDASGTPVTIVSGELVNSGSAAYDDMIVASGGSSMNTGTEQGDKLTVLDGGVHANTGTSVWNEVAVEAGGRDVFGSDAADENFAIGGIYTNEGTIDASSAEMIVVTGGLTNGGTAGYDDMTIREGGVSLNSGREEGDILTVEGSHGNTGTSIWNGITVEETGSIVNGRIGENGTPDEDALLKVGTGSDHDVFVVKGEAFNNGTLDATEVETTEVEGTMGNRGIASYDDMHIAEGGRSVNAGREEGDVLTVEGSHNNTGTSIWTGITIEETGTLVNGSLSADGAHDADALLKVGTGSDHDVFVVKGEAFNNGTLDASEVETTEVEGTLVNRGIATYDDMHVAEDGTSVNAGREEGDVLTVEGSHGNTGTSIWNGITVEETGSLVNGSLGEDGTIDADAVLNVGTGSDHDAFVVRGEAVNNGILHATEVETTGVEGSLVNRGSAEYDDMHITEGGTSSNLGTETGDVLVVEGTHDNSGTSIWSQITIAESGEAVNREGGELTVGTDAAGEKFVVDGTFVNAGRLDASKTEETIVGGTLVSSGEAHYDDMTVLEGGSSVNAGFEQGDVLTVEGSHSNTGTSIWNGIVVEETGTLVNGVLGEDGSPDADAALTVGTGSDHDHFIVKGGTVNNGTLNAAEVETTEVEGPLVNRGSAEYDDMHIAEGGTSSNLGTETGDVLVVEGTHDNSGTSIWSQITIAESGEAVNREGGELIVGTDAEGEKFVVDGTFGNDGLLDASKAEETIVGGSIVNRGEAHYDDMTVEAGGSSTNSGHEQGDILTVEGSHENSGVSIWNGIVVAEEGAAVNTETGNVDVNGRFDVEGTYENKGGLDATDTPMTNVSGELVNSGNAEYDDMTVQTGGKSENTGSEKGDVLTVQDGAKHMNSGTSIWNNVVVGGDAVNDGRLEVGSSGDSGETLVVEGDFTNNGELDASNAENTVVSGGLVNNGQANYDDMVVTDGGRSENSGYEKGDILTVDPDGSHDNSGTSIWNNVVIGGSGSNDGRLEVGDGSGGSEFTVDGDFTNRGELDATRSEVTEVSGDLTNIGRAEYDDMDISDGGTSENAGYEQGDILDINAGGSWINSGESHWNNVTVNGGNVGNSGSLEAGKVVINEGSDVGNSGSVTTDELEMNGGVLDLGAGSINAGATVINGGDLIIGNLLPPAAESRVDYDSAMNAPVNGRIWIVGNGDASFGSEGAFYPVLVGAPDIPAVSNRVTVRETVTIGETGSLAVGTDVWTDKDNHLTVSDGGLYFGADSFTLVDVESLGHERAAFAGAGVSTVTVIDGAKLMLGGMTEEGDYLITSGFNPLGNTADGLWTGGWTADDLWAPNTDGSGLKWELGLKWDASNLWVTASLEDVRNVYPDVSVPNNVNEQLDHCKNPTSADQILTCSVIKNHELDNAEKTRIINSVAELPFAAGLMASAFNDADAAADALESRVSMKGEHFNADGTMESEAARRALRVDVLGGKQKADSYEATGHVKNGFESDTFGFIMGADAKFEGRDMIMGAAFSYSDGSLDSTGDLFKTKNVWSTVGLHAYGAWKPTEVTNIVGTFSYLRSSADALMPLPAGLAYGKAETSADTDMLVLGVRGERHFAFDGFAVIPHAGLQLVYAKTGSFDTKLDGTAAYRSDADASTTFRMPIGAAVRGDMTNGSWHVQSQADLSLVPQFGDTEQSITVKGAGGASDAIEGAFTSKFTTKLDLSLKAEHANGFSAGLRYGFSRGGEGKADHALKLEMRKTF